MKFWMIVGTFLGICLANPPQLAFAQDTSDAIPDSASTSNPAGWLNIVPKACQDADGCDICEVTKVFTNAADLISAFLSAIALLMFVVGGLFLIFSAGNESRIETGKKIIIGAVTGVAIVFIAWFAVNIVVRMSALSGGSNTSSVFSREWWSFENCYPAVPDSCKGLSVGDRCGLGDCSNDYKNPSCHCWRQVVNGEAKTCDSEEEATDISGANDSDPRENSKCYCASECASVGAENNIAYTCVPEDTVKANPANYTVQNLDCPLSSQTCVLQN